MQIYLHVMFWLGLLCFIARIGEMAGSQWPKQRQPKNLGTHVAETIVGLAFLIWAAILLFRPQF